MAYLIGGFVGGVVIIWLLSMLAYRFMQTDTATPPVLVAWFVSGTIASFGMMDGGPWFYQAYFVYMPSAFAVWAYMRWKEKRVVPEYD